jgi:hypothetical protein
MFDEMEIAICDSIEVFCSFSSGVIFGKRIDYILLWEGDYEMSWIRSHKFFQMQL